MTAAVLDASALLALILGEPGGDKVRSVLTNCAMTAVNLGEVVGHFAQMAPPRPKSGSCLIRCRSFVSRLTRS